MSFNSGTPAFLPPAHGVSASRTGETFPEGARTGETPGRLKRRLCPQQNAFRFLGYGSEGFAARILTGRCAGRGQVTSWTSRSFLCVWKREAVGREEMERGKEAKERKEERKGGRERRKKNQEACSPRSHPSYARDGNMSQQAPSFHSVSTACLKPP